MLRFSAEPSLYQISLARRGCATSHLGEVLMRVGYPGHLLSQFNQNLPGISKTATEFQNMANIVAPPLWRLLPRYKPFIVPLNKGVCGPAFYWVHSLGGEVTSFHTLIGLLGPDQQFYGIQVPSVYLNAEFGASIEGMASHYADNLMEFQPQGPLLLGGWSAGATIALELAKQLEMRGRQVPLLVALDAAPFNTGAGVSAFHPWYLWNRLCNIPYWVIYDLIAQWSLKRFYRRIRVKIISVFLSILRVFQRERNKYEHIVTGFIDTTLWPGPQRSFTQSLFNALHEYVPTTYSGRVLLYVAKAQPLHHLFQFKAEWAAIAARLEVVSIRGTHLSILKTRHAVALADHLRLRLAELRETRGNSLPRDSLP